MAVPIDLGLVTAYGYAKEKGYTGTEDEFAEDLLKSALYNQYSKQYADAASLSEQRAAQSATDAEGERQAAQSAAESADTSTTAAANSADLASQSEQDAAASKTAASQSASDAAEYATDAARHATDAEAAKDSAEQSATDAEASKTAASQSEETSRRWAVGTTGSGSNTPSDTNNAFYWATVAMSAARGGLIVLPVNELPTENISTSTLYLVPSQNPQTKNTRDEYLNLDGTPNGWELIGTTELNLANYYTKSQVDALLQDVKDYADAKIADIKTDTESNVRAMARKLMEEDEEEAEAATDEEIEDLIGNLDDL